MAVDYILLASEISAAIPMPQTQELLGFCRAVLEELTENGEATRNEYPEPHTISGMTPESMADKEAEYIGGRGPRTEMSTKYCKGIVDHIQDNAIVTYAGYPVSPPTIPEGEDWQDDGVISNLDGDDMADEIEANVGAPFISPKMIAKTTAICDHIMTNAEVNAGIIT